MPERAPRRRLLRHGAVAGLGLRGALIASAQLSLDLGFAQAASVLAMLRKAGFQGAEQYYDPDNSALELVLRRKRGIPISMAAVTIGVCEALGLDARGINFPGHFLVTIEGELVDPFLLQRVDDQERDERILADGSVRRPLDIEDAKKVIALLRDAGVDAIAISLINAASRDRRDTAPLRFEASQLRGLAPAGRLDIDSTGLLVLTQDGRIARQLIGAESPIDKEYLVRVRYTKNGGKLPASDLALLNHGLSLDGSALRPAKVWWQPSLLTCQCSVTVFGGCMKAIEPFVLATGNL